MNRERDCRQSAEVSLATAAIQRGIAVQRFLPGSFPWDADTIVLSNDGSEITHEKEMIIRVSATAQEANDAPLIVLTIHPLETCRVEVEFV